MTSQIDATVPIEGTPTTASVRNNFQTARDEISALQTSVTSIAANQVAINPAIGTLGPNVQTGLSTLNTAKAPLASPALTGNPTGPTPVSTDSSTSLATTAFVATSVGGRLTQAQADGRYVPLNGSVPMTGQLVANAGIYSAGGDLSTQTRLVTPLIVIAPNGNPQINSNGMAMDGSHFIVFSHNDGIDQYVVFLNGVQTTNMVCSNNPSGPGQSVIRLGSNPSNSFAWVENASDPTWYTWNISSSDRRIKRNIVPAGDALSIVEQINVYEADQVDKETGEVQRHLDFTLIAQEVEEPLPSAYIPPLPTYEKGVASLNDLTLVSTLWRSVQQLAGRLTAVEAQLAAQPQQG